MLLQSAAHDVPREGMNIKGLIIQSQVDYFRLSNANENSTGDKNESCVSLTLRTPWLRDILSCIYSLLWALTFICISPTKFLVTLPALLQMMYHTWEGAQ